MGAHYKGGLTSHGYRSRLREYEHRTVAAKALGRPLTTSEEVHHVDGNRINNSNQNLVICDRAFHKYLHFLGRLRCIGFTRADLIRMHHDEKLPLAEIMRRCGVAEGMVGRWFKRMNIEIRRGVGGRGSKKYKGLLPKWIVPAPNETRDAEGTVGATVPAGPPSSGQGLKT